MRGDGDEMRGVTRDTIAAIATAPGAGGVAIVRLSGVDAFRISASLFRARAGDGLRESRRVYVGKLVDPESGAIVDEVLAFGMRGPNSYTGEDVVEIHCHGGSVVSRRVLECVCRGGARPAEPGEFTKRAFLSGRIDLAQAEAVADLVAARGETGMRMAFSQLEGALSARVSVLRESILRARSLCEVVLDFPDEDIPDTLHGDVAKALGQTRRELDVLAASFDRGRVRYGGARVALVGRPNVGKSSLLNALIGRDRALVSPIPGTTRDVVEASIVIEGSPLVLSDTAGMRETDDVVEAMGVDRSRSTAAEAACVLAVFDGSVPLEPDDYLIRDLTLPGRTIAVVNKADLPIRLSIEALNRVLGDSPVIRVSALNVEGLEPLTKAIARTVFGSSEPAADHEVALYRVRHYEAVRSALSDVSRAERSIEDGVPLELVAVDLAAAATALASITGAMTSEDVLDRVFADFCLGK